MHVHSMAPVDLLLSKTCAPTMKQVITVDSITLSSIYPWRLPAQRMCLWCGIRVLTIDLDRLVAFGSNQAAPTLVKFNIKNTVFSTHAPRLGNAMKALVFVTASPILKVKVSIVCPC